VELRELVGAGTLVEHLVEGEVGDRVAREAQRGALRRARPAEALGHRPLLLPEGRRQDEPGAGVLLDRLLPLRGRRQLAARDRRDAGFVDVADPEAAEPRGPVELDRPRPWEARLHEADDVVE